MGQGVLIFDEATHTYRLDGRLVPSVTTILKDMYPNVYGDIPAAVLDRKARIGTAAHKAVELAILGELDESSIHPVVRPYFDSWRRWWDREGMDKVDVISERQIYAEEGDYCGTVDLQVPERSVAYDWKCTASPVFTHAMQAWAYAVPQKYERAACVYLQKDGSIAVTKEYEQRDQIDWRATLRVYNLRRKHA